MDSSQNEHARNESPSDLSLHEAAEQYAVSARTLAQHIRCGQLPAYKTAGATGRGWRVTREALDAAGYPPRPPVPVEEAAGTPLVTQLRRELAAARRAAAVERRRAEDTDRRLGHAMLECGRLRAALAAATGAPGTPGQVDLTADEARQLVDAVRGSWTRRGGPGVGG